MFYEKKVRKPQVTLNVTALIDVCAIIVIFLVMGTYFGESSVVVPTNIQVPSSASTESLENAPRIVIAADHVTASFLPRPLPLAFFHAKPNEAGPELIQFKQQLNTFVAAIPPEARRAGVLLNVVADRKAKYRDIFDVIAVFRETGFQSMLFIAQGT